MNKVAAAVASDSSVTMSNGNQMLRSYPTAEKIFPLPLPHRLAVLHNGSTDLLRVPYSVLLSEWQRSLGDPLTRVSDYSESFTRWVEAQTGLFDDANQDNFLDWVVRDYFLAIRKEILNECARQNLIVDDWKTPQAEALLEGLLSARIEYLKQLTTSANLADVDTEAFVKAHENTVHSALEWVFDDTPRSVKGDELLNQMVSLLVRAIEPFTSDASLVFVGYGASELFPASQVLGIGGIIAGKVKSNLPPCAAVTTDDGAYISPYAQTEAMHTFLRGYHSDFLNAAHETLENALTSEVENSKDAKPPDTSKHHEELSDRFERLSWEEFVEPLVNTVGGLPRAELARMAESLVGLQVLRKLTRAEAETVGGPVDVATITRSEGFSWCRHKSLQRELEEP